MSSSKKLLQSASGFLNSAVADPPDIGDVFSTHTYTGTNANNNVQVNGIDLLNEGGLVWIKGRNYSGNHRWVDTERGDRKLLTSNNTDGELTDQGATYGLSFNNNGFTVRQEYNGDMNASQTYVSWSFRKSKRFFDVIKYTGNGTAGRTISHNAGTPGFIIVKRIDNNGEPWYCYHRSLGATKYLRLNGDQAATTSDEPWNNTEPTSSEVTLAQYNSANGNGGQYIMYVFAHDTDDDGVIQCGNLTISSQASTNVALGFEPQWILLKHSSSTSYWWLFDTQRGMTSSSFKWVYPNASDAEETKTYQGVFPISNGFTFNPANNGQFTDGDYVYIAIRKET